jgi:hypothetical protein
LGYNDQWLTTYHCFDKVLQKAKPTNHDLHAVSCCVSVVNGLSLSDRFDDTNLNTTQESDPSIPSAVMASKKEELQKQLRELDKVCLSPSSSSSSLHGLNTHHVAVIGASST